MSENKINFMLLKMLGIEESYDPLNMHFES
jgi:hypothetical protein